MRKNGNISKKLKKIEKNPRKKARPALPGQLKGKVDPKHDTVRRDIIKHTGSMYSCYAKALPEDGIVKPIQENELAIEFRRTLRKNLSNPEQIESILIKLVEE